MAEINKALNISIKESAPPIPASFLLQILDEGRANRDAEILARLVRGEITRRQAFCRMHPVISISPSFLMVFLYIFIFNNQ